MQAFDASSIIHAWDNYPIDQLPTLWEWIGAQVRSREFVMSVVAYDEISGKVPECGRWLRDSDLNRLSVSNEIIVEAMRIKALLGIAEDRYHPKGVGESDILIIATAKIVGCRLISEEGRQLRLPRSKPKMKIPTVCALSDIAVPCINFIELIKESRQIF